MAQDELVDGVVLEAPADEEHAAPAHERPHRKEVHVDAAGRVVRRMAVLVQCVLENQVIEVRLVRGEEDDRVALRERVDLGELLMVIVQRFAVAACVEEVDQVRGQVDDVRAVRRGDFAEISDRLGRNLRLRAFQLARETRDAAAEARPGLDVLADEARHLVAGPAEAALGALEGERRLQRDEVGEPRRLRRIGAAGELPALAELRERRRLTCDDAAALRVAAEHPPLAKPAGVARVAGREQVAEARPVHAVDLRRLPRDPERRHQRIVADREAGLELRVEAAPPSAAARGRDGDRLDGAVRRVGGTVLDDPTLQHLPLEAARRVEQEDDRPPLRPRPRRIFGRGLR